MPDSPEKELEQYFQRFGVAPSYWNDYQVYEQSDSLWVASDDIDDTRMMAGIRALRTMRDGYKPTTYILQVLDDAITHRRVEIDDETLQRLVFDRETITCDMSRGYVALIYRGHVLGCGLVRRDGLVTQIPKGRANELSYALDR